MTFYKMHGAGNDFVVSEDASDSLKRGEDPDLVRTLCDRRKGVGADGLLLLTRTEEPGVYLMDFFNCDGSRAGMCGNGLRCAGLFVSRRNAESGRDEGCFFRFKTASGVQTAEVLKSSANGIVRISIGINRPFERVRDIDGYPVFFGITGVPHAVIPVPDVEKTDVDSFGRKIRFHEAFAPDGTNVDFIETNPREDGLYRIRTYERGVEAETPACGTGIASSGAVLALFFGRGKKIGFLSRSGDALTIDILKESNILKDVGLTGPAAEVFCGRFPL